MTEDERQRAIRRKLGGMSPRRERLPEGPVSTGFPALDSALGGGFPAGGIAEVFGPESCGKTTLALLAAARLQGEGRTVAWIDADRTFDPTYAGACGVDVERLILAMPRSAEEALDIARRLAGSSAVDLIVVDSAAALVPELELEADIGESGPGLQARALSAGLRRFAAEASRTGAAALFLNQTRGASEFAGGSGETSAGGPALKHYAAARVELYPAGGARIRFRVLKNRASEPFGAGEIPMPRATRRFKRP